MRTIQLEITGQPITKKNSQRLVYAKGRIIPLPSSAYKIYEEAALRQLNYQYAGEPIDYPVNLSCVYYMKTHRKCDLANLLEASQDILVKAGVISDDNFTVVAGLDYSRVSYDKENPRVEITISELLPFEE